MSELFEKFPSLTRFSQGWSITEKLDGTNGQVLILPESDTRLVGNPLVLGSHDGFSVCAGSRNRMLQLGKDNMGFAKWVNDNIQMLVETLGEGRHFGEWWGNGIQRGYGLTEKRFSLFNSLRWKQEDLPNGLHVVPCLLDNEYIENPHEFAVECLARLKEEGSLAAPGFSDPEGIVMFHRKSGVAFKKTFDYDEYGKWKELEERKNNDNG